MHLFSLLTSAVIHVLSKGNIFQLCVTLPPAEAPAGYPNKNSNNKKIESARGTMGRGKGLRAFFFFLPASLRYKQEERGGGGGGGESGCGKLKRKHITPKPNALSQCWGYVLLLKVSNMVVI